MSTSIIESIKILTSGSNLRSKMTKLPAARQLNSETLESMKSSLSQQLYKLTRDTDGTLLLSEQSKTGLLKIKEL